MTRPVDAVPLLATGRHVPSDRCPCLPIQASDLLEPGVLIRIHRNLPTHRDPVPIGRRDADDRDGAA